MKTQYEKRDARALPVMGASLALLSILLLVVVAQKLVFHFQPARHEGLDSWAKSRLSEGEGRQNARKGFALPRLEDRPMEKSKQQLEAKRREEETLLSTYGWVQKSQGIARIPIDQAMEIFLESELRNKREDR